MIQLRISLQNISMYLEKRFRKESIHGQIDGNIKKARSKSVCSSLICSSIV